MKITFFLLFGLVSVFSCSTEIKSKKTHKALIPICDQPLFVEKYFVSGGGAYGGDIISAYLTDSSNFRIYLHTYDNAHETIAFECKGDDSVVVSKKIADTAIRKLKIVSSTTYSLTELRKKGVFE